MASRSMTSMPTIVCMTLCLLQGCHSPEPLYRTGYDHLVIEIESHHPGTAEYLRSLRPALPELSRPDFNHQTDAGQDYMVLLKFSYWDASVGENDMYKGELLQALPSSQLLEGYPKYIIVEGGIERWSGLLIEDGYDSMLYRFELMSMDYPTSTLAPALQTHVTEKKFFGSTVTFDRGTLWGLREPVEEMLGYSRYRVLLDELVWDATDVYVLYGQLGGAAFGRVIINPDFDFLLNAYAEESSLEGMTEDAQAAVGVDNDLMSFYRLLEKIVAHQQNWSDEFKEESTMRRQPAGDTDKPRLSVTHGVHARH